MPVDVQRVPLFDDASSYGHAALGAVLPVLGSTRLAAAVALVFLAYQVRESEPLVNKLGDIAEFGIGLLGSVALRGDG